VCTYPEGIQCLISYMQNGGALHLGEIREQKFARLGYRLSKSLEGNGLGGFELCDDATADVFSIF
jgi:hypothetical protein